MAAPFKAKRLTARQILAAHRVLEDRMTDAQIAEECGVAPRQFARWKRNPLFKKQVREFQKKFDSELVQVGIASKRGRLDSLLDQYHRALTIVEERASDPEMQRIPGGKSGFLVKQFKMIGSGKSAEVVEEFAFDAALHRELREVKKQVAIEAGQWVEKMAPTNPEGDREYGELTESERAARLAQIFDAIRTRADRPAAEGEGEVGADSGAADTGRPN